VKLLDLIVCDDIRQEIAGKQSLIGVYSDLVINFPIGKAQWPINLKIGLFLRFKVEGGDQIPESFEINCLQNKIKIASFNGDLKFPDNIQYFNLAVVNNAFQIPNPGEILFKIAFKKNNEFVNEFLPEYSLKVVNNEIPNIE
jgi:hypothetical protein